jgi:dihydroorotate dehydrogenase
LRALQEKGPLMEILNTLQQRNSKHGISRPILLKIAPDLTDSQLDDIVDIVQQTGIAGVIATNTTISRENLSSPSKLKGETGGLSGKPLTQRSTEVIAYLHKKSNGSFPIIGVGGIHSAEDAIEKLNAGASLVQLYTGFIYEGPGLIGRINKKILKHDS